MKLPSISYIVKNATGTYLRFPAAILVACVGTVAAVNLVPNESDPAVSWLMSICFQASLGISLLMTAVLVAERRGWNTLLVQAAGVLLIAAYGFTLPTNITSAPFAVTYRHLILLVSAHLLVAFAPFIGDRDTSGFWEYNKTLFLRFAMAALFSGVLFLGLTVALASIDNLFGVHIKGERYFQLWLIMAGVFNTWFFLAGVPERLGENGTATPYPKGLKVFTQYVLLPLVTVYVVILYAYAAKIILEWEWPQGWVSRLILGFSITGILSLLLVHPLKEMEEHRWIRMVWTWYYRLLVPLVVLLLLATFRRINEYGITESRYLGVVLACWLAGITLYFVFSRQKNIKIIPTSLCIIGLGIAWGPWGAFGVAERSQQNRLESLLVRNGILVDGTVRKAPVRIAVKDAEDIRSIVLYFVQTHGTAPLQPWFSNRLDSIPAGRYTYAMDKASFITGLMGIEPEVPGGKPAWPYYSSSMATSVEGYSYIADVGATPAEYAIPGHGIIVVESPSDTLCVVVRDKLPSGERVVVDLRPLCERLSRPDPMRSNGNLSSEELTAEASGEHLRVKVVLTHLNCPREDEKTPTPNFRGVVLIGYRQQ